jgi:hypothetical protein
MKMAVRSAPLGCIGVAAFTAEAASMSAADVTKTTVMILFISGLLCMVAIRIQSFLPCLCSEYCGIKLAESLIPVNIQGHETSFVRINDSDALKISGPSR